MDRFRLIIPQSIFEAVLQQARIEAPLECCGLLAGRIDDDRGYVTQYYPLKNELQSPIAFRSEADGMFAAMKAMRSAGTEILAVYHSHPTSAAVPSRYDRQENYNEDVMTMIVSLQYAQAEVRCWWLTRESASEAPWEVSTGHHQGQNTNVNEPRTESSE